MFGFLGKSRLVDKHTAAWTVDRFGWILETYGPDKPVSNTELVLPTAEFFPSSGCPETGIEEIFRNVARHAGVADWSFEIDAVDDNTARPVGSALLLQPLTQASPVQANDNAEDPQSWPISYPARFATSPAPLIACFAHQIAWHLLHQTDWPEAFGPDEVGGLCDLVTVYLGFGVFLSNSAYEFEGYSLGLESGWVSERQGSLSEVSILFATALFLRLQNGKPDIVRDHLKPKLRGHFDKAIQQVDSMEEDLAYLRSLEPRNLSLVKPDTES